MRALILGLAASVLASASANALTASQTVQKEMIIQNPDGTEMRELVAADTVIPGERLVYTVAFTNDGAEPAENIVMTQPVPAEVLFIEGSADKPGARLAVSVDGGTSFTSRGAATVMRDGEPVRASASDITHLRWTIAGPVAPGASDTVAYRGTLR